MSAPAGLVSASDLAARVVLTGASGQVGRELMARLPGVRAFDHAAFDITDPQVAAEVIGAHDIVINCAAYTNVDRAEQEASAAYAANTTGPIVLASACAQAGARLIHLSTDYVFAGTHTTPYEVAAPTRPLSVYGRTKLAAEHAVLDIAAHAHVVRTSWVYRGQGRDFVATIARLSTERDTIDVVDDQTGSPTSAADLADALVELARTPHAPRIVHAVNAGSATRFEMAQAVFAELGADPERVRPCDSSRFPRPARRPAYSVLDTTAWAEAGLTPLRSWRSALAAVLPGG